MAKQTLNIGSNPNDGTGDTLRDASTKTNDNFDEIYSTFGNGTTLNATIANATYATTAGIATLAQGLSGGPNLSVGIVTATGFVSTAATTPVSITWSGTTLSFSVAGVGTATLTLT